MKEGVVVVYAIIVNLTCCEVPRITTTAVRRSASACSCSDHRFALHGSIAHLDTAIITTNSTATTLKVMEKASGSGASNLKSSAVKNNKRTSPETKVLSRSHAGFQVQVVVCAVVEVVSSTGLRSNELSPSARKAQEARVPAVLEPVPVPVVLMVLVVLKTTVISGGGGGGAEALSVC